jgi:hypothetical protein
MDTRLTNAAIPPAAAMAGAPDLVLKSTKKTTI